MWLKYRCVLLLCVPGAGSSAVCAAWEKAPGKCDPPDSTPPGHKWSLECPCSTHFTFLFLIPNNKKHFSAWNSLFYWQTRKVPFLLLSWRTSIYFFIKKMKHILRLTGSISLASSFFPYLQGEKWDRSSSSIWGDCNYIFGSIQDCFLSCINTSEVCALWPFFQKHQLVLIKGTSYPISEGMICLNFRYSKFEGKLLSSLIFTLIHYEYVILPLVFHFTAGENLCVALTSDMEDETSQEISLCFVLVGICGNFSGHHCCFDFSVCYFQWICLVLMQYPGDSVVTGRGRINGRLAYVFSQVRFYLFLSSVNLFQRISSQ